MMTTFTESKYNDVIDYVEISHKNTSSKKIKHYLSLKRKRSKRSPDKLKNNIKSIKNKKNKKQIKTNFNFSEINENLNLEKNIENPNSDNHPIKFQNFSKNIFSVITSFLRIDDLLKLKNIGSHNIRLCINEILEFMKNNNNYLCLNEIKTSKNTFINDYDSLYCKKYFLKNGYTNINNIINVSKKDIKVKYALYHEPTNKIYYIIHNIFYNYFCSTENKEDEEQNKNWKNTILFTLPNKEYYEKFQFLDEYKNGEVAIFSMYKILLYDISKRKQDHCIYLSSTSDYVLYKKEFKLFIIPNTNKEIEFFKIYASKKYIRQPLDKIIISEEICYNHDKSFILNFSDYYIENNNKNNNNINNLICLYYSGDKKIIIYDCKLMKIVNEILSISNISKLIIDKKYLISLTEDRNINYYSINNGFSFLYNFDLNNLCNADKIKYISCLNTKYLENIFIILVKIPNNNIIKPILLYLENNINNNFYFSFIPLKNNINGSIYDDELIYTSLKNEKNINENEIKIKFVICLNDNSRNLSSDNIKKVNNFIKINDYHIKEYCANI